MRLIGHGATLESAWPSWVGTTRGLRLTELGAYRAPNNTNIHATRGMRRALQSWLEEALGDLVPGGAATLFAGAAGRVLYESMEVRPIVEGLVDVHTGDRVDFLPPASIAAQLFDILLDRAKPLSSMARTMARARWSAVVTAYGLAGLGFGLGNQLKELVAAREGFELLRDSLTQSVTYGRKTWVGLIPDLVRVNRHVIDLIGIPAVARDDLAGVLLIGTARLGERSEKDLKTVSGHDVWPGLSPLRSVVDRIAVRQVVGPDTIGEWLRQVPGESWAALRGLGNVLRHGPSLREDEIVHSLQSVGREVAKLATLDVLRARSAARAANALPPGAMKDAVVAFVGCQSPGVASVEAVLRDAGATTIDSIHGVLWGDVSASGESTASVVVTWTEDDAAAFRALGQRAIQAGMPIRVRARDRQAEVRNVLLLTNYAHRDDVVYGFPLVPYQEEMLSVPQLLQAAASGELAFRWRPHPSDLPAHVEAGAAGRPFLDLSQGKRSLEEDVDWCDVVISSLSSATCEALLSDVPVFVHVPPHWDAWAAPFHPSRRFFRAGEIVEAFVRVVGQLRDSAPEALEPEFHALRNLFGPSMAPATLDLAALVAEEKRATKTVPHARP